MPTVLPSSTETKNRPAANRTGAEYPTGKRDKLHFREGAPPRWETALTHVPGPEAARLAEAVEQQGRDQ